jgi:hypothetical protein
MRIDSAYDPESLLTGAEAAAGMTYENSRRNWPKLCHQRAVDGQLTHDEIARLAPRVHVDNATAPLSDAARRFVLERIGAVHFGTKGDKQ